MRHAVLLIAMLICLSVLPAAGAPVIVDGASNTFLIGETPTPPPAAQPPPWIGVNPGSNLRFICDGSVRVISGDPGDPYYGPDGGTTGGLYYTTNTRNISGISAPWGALLGVFVDGTLLPTPTALDFSDSSSRNFSTLSPSLQQTFFIGDGTSNTFQFQEFIVPAGATRLYLGVHDYDSWWTNSGWFTVEVVPVPGAFWLLGSGLAGLFGVRRMRRG